MEYKNANLLKETSGLIIHGTNCSGGFGSGIAGQIRTLFPEVYEAFKTVPTGAGSLGTFQPVQITDDLVIANLFSQHRFGGDGKRYASPLAIYTGLSKAFQWAELHELEIKSPKIGCGLGGLDWETEVKPIYSKLYSMYEGKVPLTIFEYEP